MATSKHAASWQSALANAITEPAELFALLHLDKQLLAAAQQAATSFKLRVPRGFVARMEIGNADDPLLKQVLPLGAELIATPGYSADPLHEQAANPLPGLLHKYHGRVLLITTGACSINCRYCFRRDFPYQLNNPGRAGWQLAIDYIAANPSISEVILSGGDPLLATDKQLAALHQQLEAISHVKTLRIHSRMPIVLPERITPEFLTWLGTSRLRIVLVTHANHANEFDESVFKAMRQLRASNIHLLNQTVLLKGINDTAENLISLSETLLDAGIMPYYLHLLDKVNGTAHFEVSETHAKHLITAMQQALPGYLIPQLVKEVAGALHKIRLI